MNILWFLVGVVVGGLVVWLTLRVRTTATRVALETKLKAAEEAQNKLLQTFDSLAAAALRSNSESFLQLAKQALETHLTHAQGDLDLRKQAVEALVKPLKETLDKIESMVSTQKELAKETRNLATALRTPQVRGRWGETTLRRVAELVGMVEHCDFVEQRSIAAEGTMKRPDMIVLLPNQRRIVVDAKTPLDAYLQSIEADSEESKLAALKKHAKQVRDRFRELAAKSYWASLECTPEFVVLFLPGEPFLSAALQEDPTLLEDAMSEKVVLATPASLFCLLSAVSYGWREEQLTENARQISQLGREIHDRIADWAVHLDKLGEYLEKAVETFNNSVGSLEHRVLVSARRFREFGVLSDKEVPELSPINTTVREAPKIEGPTVPREQA
jgi:DNA recombination protein RmuC